VFATVKLIPFLDVIWTLGPLWRNASGYSVQVSLYRGSLRRQSAWLVHSARSTLCLRLFSEIICASLKTENFQISGFAVPWIINDERYNLSLISSNSILFWDNAWNPTLNLLLQNWTRLHTSLMEEKKVLSWKLVVVSLSNRALYTYIENHRIPTILLFKIWCI